MPSNEIRYAIFNSFSGSERGSALYYSSKNVEIYCCVFINNSATVSSGSIYLTLGTLSIKKTSFSSCYSTKHQDEVYGNAVYSQGTHFTMNEASTYMCGPTSEK